MIFCNPLLRITLWGLPLLLVVASADFSALGCAAPFYTGCCPSQPVLLGIHLGWHGEPLHCAYTKPLEQVSHARAAGQLTGCSMSYKWSWILSKSCQSTHPQTSAILQHALRFGFEAHVRRQEKLQCHQILYSTSSNIYR
jgi:hypothetical protein